MRTQVMWATSVTNSADRPADSQAIFFGAWFSIEDDDGRTQQLRIVGPDETDAALGYISIDSPLARAEEAR